MASTPRDTERLQLRLERRIIEPLKAEAKRLKMANTQALIAKILEDFLGGRKQSDATTTPTQHPEIDLRSLLLEAHKANAEANRTIAELTRTITAMAQEQKNAPDATGAERLPASTAPSNPVAQRGRVRVITGLRQGSPD